MTFALDDAQHGVRVELLIEGELIGTYTLPLATLIEAVRMPDGYVLGFDPQLLRVDCIRLVPTRHAGRS